MREVCLLIGQGGEVLWSDAWAWSVAQSSPLALPDSRDRWEAIWRHRGQLAEVAHSHPQGPLGFSPEDQTTMAALDAALGRALVYSVVAPDGRVVRTVDGAARHEPVEPWWTGLLRLASGMAAPR
jgi:hypothetical protein